MNAPDSAFQIPEPEMERFLVTVDSAVGFAATGELVRGHEELMQGFRHAEALLNAGRQWGHALLLRYRLAMDNYCESYGVPME